MSKGTIDIKDVDTDLMSWIEIRERELAEGKNSFEDFMRFYDNMSRNKINGNIIMYTGTEGANALLNTTEETNDGWKPWEAYSIWKGGLSFFTNEELKYLQSLKIDFNNMNNG